MNDRRTSHYLAVSTFESLETRRMMSAATAGVEAYYSPNGEMGISMPLARLVKAETVGPVVNEAASQPVTYDAPIRITSGGVYSGNWRSLDANVPAVLILTSEPVVIENSHIQSRGELIATYYQNADVTIRNVYGEGLNSGVAGKTTGRFLHAEGFTRVVVENSTLISTAGIYLGKYAGDGSIHQSIEITGNIARNVDGRQSDGAGGYLADGWESRQFVQLNEVRHVAGIAIAWNQVINEPGRSRVEDNISIHLSSGTAASPIRIHDNYVQGAYPADPLSTSYSGGGIMLSDGASATQAGASAYVHVYDNQVISTTNYGIAISSGHNNAFYRNRIVSTGVLANGSTIGAQNVGAYIWDINNDKARGTFHSNGAWDNYIAWAQPTRGPSATNPQWMPDATVNRDNTNVNGPIARTAEEAEWQLWLSKLRDAKVDIGSTLKE